jgi:hypothetical protein
MGLVVTTIICFAAMLGVLALLVLGPVLGELWDILSILSNGGGISKHSVVARKNA